LPIPDFEIIQVKNGTGEMVPILRRVRWNLETMRIPEGYVAPTVDHKIPKCKGGSSEIPNLVLACRACNSEKADSPYEDFFRKKEPERRMNKHRLKK
jgi:5-methylcytosine-specific restriction endonuclease McrA